jgi:uncharacterized protein YdeI (YjbR/CyaY-like superfamily)
MNQAKTVEQYLSQSEWQPELSLLQEIILSTSLEECIKWGIPAYTYKGKNIIGMAGFKSYVGLWFHQGVFLKNEANVLVNAQEGVTKAMRQWRFNSLEEIESQKDLIKTYVLEAIDNQIAGKEMKAVKAKKVDIPIELKTKFDENPQLLSAYNSLTPGKQREYSQHIGSAKQEATRLKRLEKSIPMILAGVGLHDKYK